MGSLLSFTAWWSRHAPIISLRSNWASGHAWSDCPVRGISPSTSPSDSQRVTSSDRDANRDIEYGRIESPEDEDLPVTHALHWRVSRPHRTLEIRVSERTGRYWFHLLVVDELGGAGRIVDDGQGDVMRLTIADVDQWILRLADQQAWQSDRPSTSDTGGQTDVSSTKQAVVLLQPSGRCTHGPVMNCKGADDAVHPVRR
jgi:hypothetical protein